ncbi:MAG TPA: protein kinase, partial [Longimicrobiales bacterium]|nr:protein kinase [Longimicrobiales bacterium]
MSTERLNAALGGRYRIERELGQGGMATVYLAEDLRHERHVALKVLRPELAAVVGAERFLAEIKTTANLHHPHILPLHDSGEADGFLFYVMPYVEDESLRDRMRREAQLPVDEAVEIAKRVCGALQHAHERGVIHRDIKPANILVQDGEPVVADFGIALAMSAAGGTRLTETGLSVGTPYYMSPEQATGDQEVGPRSDVYSLGCVLHEMLVGDPPYGGSTAQAVLAKIIAGGPVAPTRSRPSIPAHVDAAIRKALERLPADRFADAQVFARALADPAFRYGDEPTPGVTADSLHWKRLAVGGWGVAALGLAFSGWLVATRSGPGPVARFPLVLPEEEGLFYTGPANLPRFDLLPDGSGLVYVSRMDPRAAPNLHSRAFDRLEGRPLPGTRGASTPTVSPDGRRVAFRTFEGGLGIASLAGGPATLVVESGVVAGAAWASDDEVYYLTEPGFELRRVAADGGGSESVVELEPTPAEGGYGFVDLLPGNDAAIVTAFPADRSDLPAYAVHVVDLGTGRSAGSVAGLIGVYAHSGHLLYVTADGVLTGTRLNARSL